MKSDTCPRSIPLQLKSSAFLVDGSIDRWLLILINIIHVINKLTPKTFQECSDGNAAFIKLSTKVCQFVLQLVTRVGCWASCVDVLARCIPGWLSPYFHCQPAWNSGLCVDDILLILRRWLFAILKCEGNHKQTLFMNAGIDSLIAAKAHRWINSKVSTCLLVVCVLNRLSIVIATW